MRQARVWFAVFGAAVFGLGCAAGAFLQGGASQVYTDHAQGELRLEKPSSPFDERGMHIVELGDKLDFECRFYIDDFFDKSIIWAGANISNPGDTPMFFEYNVAFFDEKGELIGCASQGSYGGVEPKQTTQLGSCLIALEPQDIERVGRYQVRVYESDREVGAQPPPAAE